MFGRRLLVTALTAVIVGGLGGCSGGRGDDSAPDRPSASVGGAPAPAPAPETVTGLRDETRHLAERTTRATRPRTVRRCTTGTRRVRHTSRSGSGIHRTTRTWYTTEHERDCRRVRSGTETYTEVLRPERWCVRLDDVDGDREKDDVWYRVTRADYDTALAADDHARLEFVPQGRQDAGC
ncbi:hypothetical protein AB0N17_08840 [Streptomyces sp. NPDC051133]|uniref:hypothetical protein n=1 Tax=Streptomyces sp. NPDC051133 TaxID=3155521 RepID=UPI00341C0460